jgi:hyperosmotically inducible periplasmic protein
MRNLKRWLFAGGISAVMAVAGLTGCSSTKSEHAEYHPPDDGSITHEVKKRLDHDPAFKFPEVSVKTFDRVVQLSGFAATSDQRQRAEQVARTVEGVTQVVNNIALKPNPNLTPTGHTQYYY